MTTATYGTVQRTERLAPRMLRVHLDGPGLAGLRMPTVRDGVLATDAYVNAQFPRDASLAVPFDDDVVRGWPREQRPAARRYTVSGWTGGVLSLDVVLHGSEGVAGPWAQQARPGDRLQLRGPSGAYAPDPTADAHLMVGDESALPAIAASLSALPAGARAYALLEVDGPADELALPTAARLDLRWVHRRAGSTGEQDDLGLLAAVQHLGRLAGRVQAFVHGEAVATRAVRALLLGGWGLAREDLSCSPYWRRQFTDEAWREVKQQWQRDVEADV